MGSIRGINVTKNVILDWFVLILPNFSLLNVILFEEKVQVQKQKGNPTVVVLSFVTILSLSVRSCLNVHVSQSNPSPVFSTQ